MVARSRHPISAADGRPRIFVRPMLDGYAWRIGHGTERGARTVGEAVGDALDHVEHQPAVIIYGEHDA